MDLTTFYETLTKLKPLIIFILAISIYSIFTFKFYRFLAKKNIVSFNLHQYNRSSHPFLRTLFAMVLYVIEYIILTSVFVFFWFAFLATLLVILSKGQPLESILLVSMAVMGAVRMTSYYNEDLSRDLAKMLPFALLGVFLVDISYINFTQSLETIKGITNHTETLIYYFGFIIVLEIILRIFYFASILFGTEEKKKIESEEE